MDFQTISWVKNSIKIVDQSKLPAIFEFIYLTDIKTLWKAIKKMKIRGAPALGIAGALGVVLGIKDSKAKKFSEFKKEIDKVVSYLSSSRPTAVNLFWAMERIRKKALDNKDKPVKLIKDILVKEALDIIKEDKTICRKIATYGAKLIKNGDRVLTHCNAGALATADYGTALGILYKAKEIGRKFKVYVDETRPLLQGARLSSWELKKRKIDTTLICDNMVAICMREKKINKIIVGADRITANGDCANKIGTYSIACLAKLHKVPFYVAAPLSTFDFKLKRGWQIPIEQRNPCEITHILNKRIAPVRIKVYNPAFDVTPAEFITAIITERGIFYPPYKKTLKKLTEITR